MQQENRRGDVDAVAQGEHGTVNPERFAKEVEDGDDGGCGGDTFEEVLGAVVMLCWRGALSGEHRSVEEDVEGVVEAAVVGLSAEITEGEKGVT